MKHFLLLSIPFLVLSTCKPLERKVMLVTLPIEEKNDSTLILKAHLIDYNPQKPIKKFGFMIYFDSDNINNPDFSQSPINLSTSHPDSVHLEHFSLLYTDRRLIVAPNETKKVFVKSYVFDNQIHFGNVEKIELSYGYFENISSTSTSITFDYVIDLSEDCLNNALYDFQIEFGFYYHTQPQPSENNHIGKISDVLADDFLLTCLFGSPRFRKTYTITNLQPNTTYYFRFYTKRVQIRYGSEFRVTTQP